MVPACFTHAAKTTKPAVMIRAGVTSHDRVMFILRFVGVKDARTGSA